MNANSQPIHVAITRRIKPGCEQEFQTALMDFFARSLTQGGVHSAAMLVPLPNSSSTEYGIIRSFANAAERDAFYASPLYLEWKKRVAPLTEGEREMHEVHGLEVLFRGNISSPPPTWKMAVATYLGVLPVVMFLALTLGRLIRSWNFVLNNIVFNACVVGLLTWPVMPIITKALARWLQPK